MLRRTKDLGRHKQTFLQNTKRKTILIITIDRIYWYLDDIHFTEIFFLVLSVLIEVCCSHPLLLFHSLWERQPNIIFFQNPGGRRPHCPTPGYASDYMSIPVYFWVAESICHFQVVSSKSNGPVSQAARTVWKYKFQKIAKWYVYNLFIGFWGRWTDFHVVIKPL